MVCTPPGGGLAGTVCNAGGAPLGAVGLDTIEGSGLSRWTRWCPGGRGDSWSTRIIVFGCIPKQGVEFRGEALIEPGQSPPRPGHSRIHFRPS